MGDFLTLMEEVKSSKILNNCSLFLPILGNLIWFNANCLIDIFENLVWITDRSLLFLLFSTIL